MAQIGSIIVATYTDALRLLRDMWSTVLVSSLAVLATSFIGGIFQSAISTDLGDTVVTMLSVVAGLWFSAPYALAQYRYLAFGEKVMWPSPFQHSPIVERVFAVGALISLVWALPGLAVVLTRPHWDGPIYYTGPNPPQVAHFNIELVTLLVLVISIVMLRLATLVSGTAVGDVPTVKRAFADSRGHFWVIAISQMATMAPVAALFFVALAIHGSNARLGFTQPILLLVMNIVSGVLAVALGSQFYRRFGASAPPSASA